MSSSHLMLLDPGIAMVTVTFISVTAYVIKKVFLVNKELVKIINFLKNFKKSDLKFRFKELDDYMYSNPYVTNLWSEFKNTLIFSENVSLKDEKDDMVFESLSDTVTSIQCSIEPTVFFNEETLVNAKMNHKVIQVAPTVLTGMGPLFTFLHIGEAFSKVDFSSQDATVASVGGLMGSMQLAATVSVLAVGASLIFLIIEKFLFSLKCKKQVVEIEEMISKLFDSISSEKFLIELLRETKIQNNNTKNLLAAMPLQFKKALDKSLTTILTPYLENVLYGLNKIQEKTAASARKGSDAVDDLF